MSMLHRFAASLCIAAAAAVLMTGARAESTRVTFILVNDIYEMGDQLMPDGERRGGFARLAAVVKAERAKGGHVLLAHGGDTLSPSLMSGIDQGAHIIALTNMIRPDIFVPGNHEFDFGKAVFFKRMAEAKFPLFAANLRAPDGKPLPGFKDRAIISLDGVRIGLTGAAYEGTPGVSSPEDLTFLPTVAAIRQQAESLRHEGADFVVAVVHADRGQGAALMAAHTADLILTGHSHDLLVNFDGRSAMAESAYDALYVTVIDVTINVTDRDGRRAVAWWPQFRIVDTATVSPDPEVAAAVAHYGRELSRELDVPLAVTAVELDSRNAILRTREAAIGNLVADAMRAETGADVTVMNGGGIRSGRVYEPGASLTRRDILAELPFNNRLVTIELKGRALREGLENGISLLPGAAGRFPQISGAAVEYDTRRPPGQRILAVRVAGEPLDPDKTYRIATNDFLARGGDGYGSFASAPPALPVEDSPLLVNAVMDYLRRLGTIRTQVEGRMIAK
jgi:5'-nucleotidase/UDP-sugar diphosphatase